MEVDKSFIQTLNEHGRLRKPLFFAIDFLGTSWFLEDENVLFKLEEHKNFEPKNSMTRPRIRQKNHMSFEQYEQKFDQVIEEIRQGNTYLLNLTAPTSLQGKLDLESIFYHSSAPFKLCYKDKFICFSPERFVQIKDQKISTYPMKGTIDAAIVGAKEQILNNAKEMAEHVMVVDLLRNDLSLVASGVCVERFRYVEQIDAGEKKLLHVSSKITGDLPQDWQDSLGDIVARMLPAGSISGTPKRKTLELIEKIEGYERGYFSGIFGYFDGKNFDSAVMIRFIEKTPDGYVYKSGGGITIDSSVLDEFAEMKDKVYVPLL